MILLLAIISTEANSQNPFLKKYAGSYYLLPFGIDYPTESSEKIIFTSDGKWTSTSRPVDDNEVVSKLPVKKVGSWKASEGLIQISYTEKGTTLSVDFKLDEGLFLSNDTYLQKIFITDPIYVNKYAGSFYMIRDEDKPTALTTKLFLKKDGKCVIETPNIDENGVTQAPLKEVSTWKAREGVIQVYYKEDDQEKVMEFTLTDNVFKDRHYNSLKKIPPPPPPNPYFKQYAGTYQMLTDGVPATDEMDQYEFTMEKSNGHSSPPSTQTALYQKCLI